MNIKKEFKYDPIGCHRKVNPYSILYCYPQTGQPYIVKGGLNDCECYLRQTVKVPTIVHTTLWWKNKCRMLLRSYGFPEGIDVSHSYGWPRENDLDWGNDMYSKPIIVKNVRNVKRHKVLISNKFGPSKEILSVRRLPRSWIKEIDQFIA